MTKKLVLGNYETRSICDHNCIFKGEIVKLTAKTATVKIDGETKRCKIHTYNNEEFIYPFGSYSMAPIFRSV